jgi:zinc/manganese transport system substrate-binding protein
MPVATLLAVLCIAASSAHAERIKVLTTFSPMFSLTKNVTGDVADISMLLPPSAEPHDFALRPSDLKRIAEADVIVRNGLGLESWLDRALQTAAKKSAAIIDAGEGLEVGGDAHVWLDPQLAIRQVARIRDGIAALDPAHSDTYAKNAANYIRRLDALDREISAVTSGITDKKIVSFHQSLHYFAARYKFEVVAVIETFPGQDPTPRYIRNLRQLVQSAKVRVMFSEPQSPRRLVDSLAASLGLKVAMFDPMEKGEPSGELYETVMRSNLQSLMTALHGEK